MFSQSVSSKEERQVKVNFAVGMGRNEKIYEIADHSRVAEESGFRHITFGDVQNCTRDLYVKMALAATATHRVKIGSGVVAPYTRHAVVTATSHATIDELSGGRTFLGVGSCGTSHGFLDMKPASLKELEELVKFYRTFLAGKEATYKELTTQSEWVCNPMPIYLAVERPRALQLAGRHRRWGVFHGWATRDGQVEDRPRVPRRRGGRAGSERNRYLRAYHHLYKRYQGGGSA